MDMEHWVHNCLTDGSVRACVEKSQSVKDIDFRCCYHGQEQKHFGDWHCTDILRVLHVYFCAAIYACY